MRPGNLVGRFYERLSPYRRAIAVSIYLTMSGVAYAAAFVLRFDLRWPGAYTATFLVTLPILVGSRAVTNWLFKLAAGRWRYVGVRDVVYLVGATTSGSLAFWSITYLVPLEPSVPGSVILMEWIITAYGVAGIWLLYRGGFEFFRRRAGLLVEPRRRALVIGAGEAGSRLVHEMLRSPAPYQPMGFVDDDPVKWGMAIEGVEVIGSTKDLAEIADHERAEELIIAMPGADPKALGRIVESCIETGLPYKVLPGIAEVLSGHVTVNQLREIRIEDLLGREPVALALPELVTEFKGRTVLITGAAGSIGSELARQIAVHAPDRIVLLDRAESDLYLLELELREEHDDRLEIIPVIGDILDPACCQALFDEYAPERVFHAAAYKHVPLMEANAREAIRNNIVGTVRLAVAAGEAGAERFVLISTDKAVEPTSVMGATKRVAELVILACQARYTDTTFTAVRFGNVLGSQGSVVPIFKRQLREGKPLTVTHPETTRFFMTISEAVQLILQASVLPEAKGRITMLEMGEPVKILDLARNLLRLSGADRAEGESIRFVGLRPGEKLHEELTAPTEEPLETRVPKVRLIKSRGPEVPGDELFKQIRSWESRLALGDGGIDEILYQIYRWCVKESSSLAANAPKSLAAAHQRKSPAHLLRLSPVGRKDESH